MYLLGNMLSLTLGIAVGGICEGIDANGGIRIRQDGEVKSYYGGEISLRKASV